MAKKIKLDIDVDVSGVKFGCKKDKGFSSGFDSPEKLGEVFSGENFKL